MDMHIQVQHKFARLMRKTVRAAMTIGMKKRKLL